MAQYQRVYPRYWPDMRGLPLEVKLTGLYVLTSRHRTTEGFYHLPVAYAADDIELSPRRTQAALEQLQVREFISYDDDAQLVLVRKALTYPGQAPATPKQVQGALRAIEHLTPSPLWAEFQRMADRHAPLLAEALTGRSNGGIPSGTHTETHTQSHTETGEQ